MIKSHTKSISEILGRDPVHPFPARMAPGIALEIVKQTSKPIKVLDPMAGSGTVLAVARAHGHQAIGIDLDPLAVLISNVWISPIDRVKALDFAQATLSRAREKSKRLRLADAYPSGADEETKQFIRYWFDPYARTQLASLANEIQEIRDEPIQRALWCAFSRLIIAKQAGASLAMDLAHSRPHKAYTRAPAKPFNRFEVSVDKVLNNCLHTTSPKRGPRSKAIEGDARRIPLASNSVDLVLTSPPYLNAIDYMRCSKYSLVWMGYSVDQIKSIRSSSVGSEISLSDTNDPSTNEIISSLKLEPGMSGRNMGILRRYIKDMRGALAEVGRVLKSDGSAIYVLGENTIQGTYIRTSKIVTAAAELAGLRLVEKRSRALPANRRYLPPPTNIANQSTFQQRMRREIVLAFKAS